MVRVGDDAAESMGSSRQETTPRHYAPQPTRNDPPRVLRIWSQTEIMIGAALAMVGGFVVRGGGGYGPIVVGSTLILLGLFHLVQIDRSSSTAHRSSPISRLILRLDQDLDAHYTLARDYPTGVGDRAERIDLLVVGPGGWFGIDLLDVKGTVDGGEEDDRWRVAGVEDESGEPIPNPVRELRRKLEKLTQRVPEEIRGRISPEPLVVPQYHRTDGSAFECEAVHGWNDLGKRIRLRENTEQGLSLEEVETLESRLGLPEYD